MTAILDRVPVAEVSRRARKVRFGKTLLAAVTGVLFGAGWLVAKLFAVAWLALSWMFTSARLGWEHARLQAEVPRLSLAEQAELQAEVERLRADLEAVQQPGRY